MLIRHSIVDVADMFSNDKVGPPMGVYTVSPFIVSCFLDLVSPSRSSLFRRVLFLLGLTAPLLAVFALVRALSSDLSSVGS